MTSSDPATQATPATISEQELSWLEDDHYEDEDETGMFSGLCAECFGEWPCLPTRLIATARAYHRLREAADAVNGAAQAMSIRERNATAPKLWLALYRLSDCLREFAPHSEHPACDPTDAGSGDVATEAQSE